MSGEFLPTATIHTLQQRSELISAIRKFLVRNGYWECETPLLANQVVIDANLDPFVTRNTDGKWLYLQTSPEAGMKRLLAAGATAIFQITRAMRRGESGRLHNPEFSMLEWYRAGDDHHAQMDFVERLVRCVYRVAAEELTSGAERLSGTEQLSVQDGPAAGDREESKRKENDRTDSDRRRLSHERIMPRTVSGESFCSGEPGDRQQLIHRDRQQLIHHPGQNESAPGKSVPRELSPWESSPRFERLTYDEAFERFAGSRVLHLDVPALRRMATEHQIETPAGMPSDDRDPWLNLLLAELVEPHLGREAPQFVYDFPASQAALARIRGDAEPGVSATRPGNDSTTHSPVAERFELYDRGIELCNGYHELTDPDELTRREIEERRRSQSEAIRQYPEPSLMKEAMRHGLPACSGVALGLDRLIMLALGRDRVSDVIAFPLERA